MGEHINGTAAAQGGGPAAAEKLAAAFTVLVAAFEDARVDAITLTKQELLDQAVAAQQVLNTAWAIQSARLAQAAAVEETPVRDHTAPGGYRTREIRHTIGAYQDEFIGCEVGPLLGWASGQALARVAQATDAITRTPRLFRHMAAGQLEPAKLATVHRALARTSTAGEDGHPVTLDHARRVEAALLGEDPDDAATTDRPDAVAAEQANLGLLVRQSARQLGQRTTKILAAVDQAAATGAAERRRRDRVGVFTHPDDEPGLTHLHAILPTQAAASVMAAVDQLAHHLHADTTTGKTLAECRADALTDLILDHADITTDLVIHVPLHHAPAATGAAGTAFHPPTGDHLDAGPGGNSRHPGWPPVFAHPITGLPVHPPAATGGPPSPAAVGTGATLKTAAQVETEFNTLLQRLYPPDPADEDPADLADDWAAWQEHQRYCDDTTTPALRWPPPHARPTHTPGTSAAPPLARNAHGPTAAPAGVAWLGDALIPGVGIIPAPVIQELSRSFGTTITRALTDTATGTTVETSHTSYRPAAKLAAFVRTRDQHCRFPGCTRPARYCDIDHLTPWPAGTTTPANLHCLCRHHHRTKQATGWTVTMTPDGVCTWTSPTTHTYTTTPAE